MDKQTPRNREYFKIQWHDAVSLAWKDLQKAFDTEAEARGAMTSDKVWRVMAITSKGRRPL